MKCKQYAMTCESGGGGGLKRKGGGVKMEGGQNRNDPFFIPRRIMEQFMLDKHMSDLFC